MSPFLLGGRILIRRSSHIRHSTPIYQFSIIPIPYLQATCYGSTPAPWSKSDETTLGSNPGLESVIGQGIASLQRTATDVQAKTKKVTDLAAPLEKVKTHKQLAETQRVFDTAVECLEAICHKQPNNPLAMRGEPIAILDVQVNSNSKLAKVYWTLPYGILMDDRLTPSTYQRLVAQMEKNLEDGGASLLQRHVHTRLRSYYPPRLKFFLAPPNMVAEALGDYSDV